MGHVGHGSTAWWVTGHERWPISISDSQSRITSFDVDIVLFTIYTSLTWSYSDKQWNIPLTDRLTCSSRCPWLRLRRPPWISYTRLLQRDRSIDDPSRFVADPAISWDTQNYFCKLRRDNASGGGRRGHAPRAAVTMRRPFKEDKTFSACVQSLKCFTAFDIRPPEVFCDV